jgi:hypothetical protein
MFGVGRASERFKPFAGAVLRPPRDREGAASRRPRERLRAPPCAGPCRRRGAHAMPHCLGFSACGKWFSAWCSRTCADRTRNVRETYTGAPAHPRPSPAIRCARRRDGVPRWWPRAEQHREDRPAGMVMDGRTLTAGSHIRRWTCGPRRAWWGAAITCRARPAVRRRAPATAARACRSSSSRRS